MKYERKKINQEIRTVPKRREVKRWAILLSLNSTRAKIEYPKRTAVKEKKIRGK